jgi:hypothetical protein
LAAAFLYFDVSFMVWVILGPGATATSPCKAQFNGKANIQDITNPLAPVSNNALQFSMTDYAPRALATAWHHALERVRWNLVLHQLGREPRPRPWSNYWKAVT